MTTCRKIGNWRQCLNFPDEVICCTHCAFGSLHRNTYIVTSAAFAWCVNSARLPLLSEVVEVVIVSKLSATQPQLRKHMISGEDCVHC